MKVKLLEKLEEFNELEKKLSDPKIIKNTTEYTRLSKEYSNKKPLIDNIKRYIDIDNHIIENQQIIDENEDRELKEMAEKEILLLKKEKEQLIKKIRKQLLPVDINDDKNIILEIRAGTGGEEAALFASDLFRMYKRYAETKGFKIEPMNLHSTELGGIKEIIISVKGENVYKYFKYESGTHRVQRVPETESGGRIHTSAVTVAVLPEIENIEIELNEKDLKIDVFHSSGAGGQNVNNVATAIRITYIPENIVVTCQDERSQYKNKEKAKRILKARLYDLQLKKQRQKISQNRKSQIGTGDRSQRIRTYNFQEGRVTDHRINLTIYRLDDVLNGNLDLLIIPLIEEEQNRKLEQFWNEEKVG